MSTIPEWKPRPKHNPVLKEVMRRLYEAKAGGDKLPETFIGLDEPTAAFYHIELTDAERAVVGQNRGAYWVKPDGSYEKDGERRERLGGRSW